MTPPTLLSTAGFCPAVSGRKEQASHGRWLPLVRLLKAAAHVPHGNAGDDQPYPVPRYSLDSVTLSGRPGGVSHGVAVIGVAWGRGGAL